jgi:hypothetical protein
MAVIPAPDRLKAFPGAERVKPKGRARRWSDAEYVYEWDGLHGRVEKYTKTGHHLGEYDPDTGELTKDREPGRRIEV